MIKLEDWKRAIEAFEYDSFHKVIDAVATDIKTTKFTVNATVTVSFNNGNRAIYEDVHYAKSRLKPYLEALK